MRMRMLHGAAQVVATGAAVEHFHEGDRVLIGAVTACGRCPMCRIRRLPSLCEAGGWILGNTVDGTQARPLFPLWLRGAGHESGPRVCSTLPKAFPDPIPMARGGCAQAEYVRVPHADGSLHALPPGGLSDADACMFSDVFPTAYECAAPAAHAHITAVESVVGSAGLLSLAVRRLPDRLRVRCAAASSDCNRQGVSTCLPCTPSISTYRHLSSC